MDRSHPDPSLDDAVCAGVAIFNAGEYHAAHDAWEDLWLDLDRGSPDERFLHGLIQYSAALFHAIRDNVDGARGLATSAHSYLAGLPNRYHGVGLTPIRQELAALAADPSVVHRHEIPPMVSDGRSLSLADLNWEQTVIAAAVIAEEGTQWEESVVRDAAVRATEHANFRALVIDFVRNPTHRALIYDRLAAHIERERAKDADVAGLFNGDDNRQE